MVMLRHAAALLTMTGFVAAAESQAGVGIEGERQVTSENAQASRGGLVHGLPFAGDRGFATLDEYLAFLESQSGFDTPSSRGRN
jgi:hypothetical protein